MANSYSQIDKPQCGCHKRVVVVVVVTLFIQGGPFSYEAGIQRGPVYSPVKELSCQM